MRFVSLGSGSKGNATVIASEECTLLVDCGFSAKELVARLALKDVSPSHIDAVLVTHEHGDHSKGVAAFSKKYNVPVYMTHGTARGMKLFRYQYQPIHDSMPFFIKDIEINIVAVPHDSLQASQFIFRHNNLRLGILTDIGHVTEHVKTQYRDCDALLLEFNHDLDMLAKGPYPPH